MKTKFLLKNLKLILIGIMMLPFVACEKSEIELMPGLDFPTLNSQAWPEGNTLSTLNGNVFIKFPPGAVESPIDIDVTICEVGNDCNFLLNMVEIQPRLNFQLPVTISLKYNGELVCNESCPEDCNVIVCFWETEYDYLNRFDYMNRLNVKCINCAVNPKNKTVNFQTMKTGLFGLSISNFDVQ